MTMPQCSDECQCYKCSPGRYYISPERQEKMEKQIKGLRSDIIRFEFSDEPDKKSLIETYTAIAADLEERLKGKVYCPCCTFIPEMCKCSKEDLLDCAIQLEGSIETVRIQYENLLWERMEDLKSGSK